MPTPTVDKNHRRVGIFEKACQHWPVSRDDEPVVFPDFCFVANPLLRRSTIPIRLGKRLSNLVVPVSIPHAPVSF